MYETGADYTNTFRNLNQLQINSDNEQKSIENHLNIILNDLVSLEELKKVFENKLTEFVKLI
jgi:hypothetical protein